MSEHEKLLRPPFFDKLKQDSRPQRGLWAPGEYWCRCRKCPDSYIGDKRSMWCADCAYAETQEAPVMNETITITIDLRKMGEVYIGRVDVLGISAVGSTIADTLAGIGKAIESHRQKQLNAEGFTAV